MMILILLIVDSLLINLGIIGAFLARFSGELPIFNFSSYENLWVFITIILIGSFYFFGLYDRKRSYTTVNILDNVVKGSIFGTLLLFVSFYSVRLKVGTFPTSVLWLSTLINIVSISAWHILVNNRSKAATRRLLIVGSAKELVSVIDQVTRNKRLGYSLIGVLDESPSPGQIADIRYLDSEKNLRTFLVREHIDEVIIAFPDRMHDRISDIVAHGQGLGVRFRIMPNLYEIFLSRTDVQEIDGLPLIELMVAPIQGLSEFIKRIIDIVVSLIGLALFLPILLILLLFYRLEDLGSIFFKQERVGKNGKIFLCYKLRTMQKNAEVGTGPVMAEKNDQRVTRVGRFLRMSRLDEVPQFINVLIGEMSLVGPRPERPFFVERFKKEIPGYVERLKVKPGITGLAQVNSGYDISPADKLRFDLLYIRKQSAMLDLKIMVKTTWVMLTKKGAQ